MAWLDRNTLVGMDFLLMGALISGLGFLLAGSIPIASFGFALAVIGALVILVVPEPVPPDALKSLLKDSIRNVEIILEESGLRNRAYFVQMGDGEVRGLVPLSSAPLGGLELDVEELEKAPRRFVVDFAGVSGLMLIPPGNEIVRLADVQRGADLEQALRSALVEYSDLARGVLAVEEEEGRLAKVQITRPQLDSDSPYFNDAFGTPVSCVASCVAAAVKGTPVRIKEERYDRAIIRLVLESAGVG